MSVILERGKQRGVRKLAEVEGEVVAAGMAIVGTRRTVDEKKTHTLLPSRAEEAFNTTLPPVSPVASSVLVHSDQVPLSAFHCTLPFFAVIACYPKR